MSMGLCPTRASRAREPRYYGVLHKELTATTRLGYFYSSPLCTWTMSKNLFAKAVEDATLEITTSYDGSRNFGGKGNHFTKYALWFLTLYTPSRIEFAYSMWSTVRY